MGREQDMFEVRRELATTRLMTLTGVGGFGKSRLALEVARNLVDTYPDGVWLEELAPLSEAALDLLTPTSLQSLVYAHDQRISFGHQHLHQQPQENATHLPTRPAGTAEDPMVAMESLVLVQAHRAQGRADGSASRSCGKAPAMST